MKKCPNCGREYGDSNTLCPSDGAVLQREDELVGQTLIGKYRIDERISEGGMGCVYRATHVLMEKVVAIKVLHPALAADETIVARFTREAKAASRISHPHALTVTDFGESENGVVFLVMEYLPGSTLKEVIRTQGPMPLKRVAEIVRQVAGALEAAHAVGVVHRDLKSDNIMLDKTSGGGDWAKVLDFGIAKIKEKVDGTQTDPGLTAPNLIIGTPQYMSPEQCSQAANIDARSDIYSLGIIIYEMLAGHVPFAGDSPTETMMKHLQDPVPSILDERRDIPSAIDQVIRRAMAKKPEDRFQRAGELSEALQLAASENPALAGVASDAVTGGAGSVTDGQGISDPRTNRITIPTGENQGARNTGEVDWDEETVVSARRRGTGTTTPPPVPAATFNPWRVAIPAVALLAVVFGLFYFLQGNEAPGGAQEQPAQTDANGQPVVSVTPPTGEGERDITPSNSSATPTPSTEASPGSVVNPSETNTSPEATPTPAQGEEDEEGEEPTPERTPTNTNRRAPTPPPATTNANVSPPAPERPTPQRPAPTPPPVSSGDVPAPVSPQP